MRRVTKKQTWFKMHKLTSRDNLYVGLDVHKNSIAIAFYLNGRIELTFNTSAQHTPLIRQLLRVKQALRLIVYEAGPTGYSLARALKKAGLPVRIISPATTPRPARRHRHTRRFAAVRTAGAPSAALPPPALRSTPRHADRSGSTTACSWSPGCCRSRRAGSSPDR